jgi:alkylated DNA repair protein alkB family protein 1
MVPEAAIVNLYSPGDTLSLHRDVSESCDQGLVSISLGCDAVFVIGLDDRGDEGTTAGSEPVQDENEDSRCLVLRLRSGDAVYMSAGARYAWHGVPQIIPKTCPDWLEDWPANSKEAGCEPTEFDHWRGWMANKRVNLNVRQMYGN